MPARCPQKPLKINIIYIPASRSAAPIVGANCGTHAVAACVGFELGFGGG